MNDEAVFRTALATPGLLKKDRKSTSISKVAGPGLVPKQLGGKRVKRDVCHY